MDWTGGTRRRFAGAKNNNTALQRQKAHFAKARAAVRHEPDAGRRGTSAIAHHDDTRARSRKGLSQVSTNQNDTSTNKSRATGFFSNYQQHKDEELRLLANRRKLLSRNDWLALDSTRPLRINFPASDKDRIGRRKKVKRPSATKVTAVERQALTPLLEKEIRHPDYLMTGALSPTNDEHIEIRVGTSALDSHGHPAWDPHASRDGSPCPSTGLSHLSEEPMLLGADGDTFDADQVEVPAFLQGGQGSSGNAVRSLSLRSDARSYETDQKGSTAGRRHEPQESGVQTEANITGTIVELRSPVLQVIEDSSIGHYIASQFGSPVASDEQRVHEKLFSSGQVLTAAHETRESAGEETAEANAEALWKQLMGIPANSDTLASRKDPDTSSQRVPTAVSDQGAAIHGPLRDTGQDDTADLEHVIQMPHQNSFDIAQHREMLSEPPQMPMDSLQDTGVQQTSCARKCLQDDEDNEALWREFIIGSQDSESEDELHLTWQSRRSKAQPSSEPRSLELSGLGTSDNATMGEASMIRFTQDTTQGMGPDGHVELEDDSIEDPSIDSLPTATSPRNIHTISTKKLDPMRFKKPREIGPMVITRSRSRQNTAATRIFSHRGLKRRTQN